MEDGNSLVIREFGTDDIDQLVEIENQAFPKTPYTRESLLGYARAVGEGFVVLEKGKDILGYIIFDAEGHVYSTAVKEKHRRKGLGALLFTYASKHSRGKLWLEVRSKNSMAISFYKSMGMKTVGRIGNYYGTDDALIMALKNSAPR